MKTAFPHRIPPACCGYCVHEDCSGSQTVNVIISVTLWNQYVNNWFSMHTSSQWAPALFMRHTIAVQVPCAFFSLRWNHSFMLFLNSKGIYFVAVGLTVSHFSGQKQGSWRLDAQTWERQPSAEHPGDSHPAGKQKVTKWGSKIA